MTTLHPKSSHLRHHTVPEMTTLASIVVIVTTVCFQCSDWYIFVHFSKTARPMFLYWHQSNKRRSGITHHIWVYNGHLIDWYIIVWHTTPHNKRLQHPWPGSRMPCIHIHMVQQDNWTLLRHLQWIIGGHHTVACFWTQILFMSHSHLAIHEATISMLGRTNLSLFLVTLYYPGTPFYLVMVIILICKCSSGSVYSCFTYNTTKVCFYCRITCLHFIDLLIIPKL